MSDPVMTMISKELMLKAATELDEKNAEITKLHSLLASAVKIAGEAAEEWDKAPAGMRAGKILLALAGHRRGYRPDTDAIHAALNPLKLNTAIDRSPHANRS